MPAQQLLAWAIHLYARQQRRENGEEIEVLAFHVVDKTHRPTKRASEALDDQPTKRRSKSVVRRKATSATAIGSGTLHVRPDLSDDEDVTPPATLAENIVFEAGSPGAAGKYWKHKIRFLKSLCKSQQYTKLVCWLEDHQVCYAPIEFVSCLTRIFFRNDPRFHHPMDGAPSLCGPGGRTLIAGSRSRCTKTNLDLNPSKPT